MEIGNVVEMFDAARFPEPLFHSCTLTVGFRDIIFPLGKVRDKVAKAPLTDFVFDGGASTDVRLVLHSVSGHSHFLINPDGAVVSTAYTGPYVSSAPDACKLRSDYAAAKLRAVLDLIRLAGAELSLFGVTLNARATSDEASTVAELRRAAAASLGVDAGLAEGGPVHDFLVRASRSVGEDVFSNLQVAWFEERVFNMGAVSPHMLVGAVLREWNASVSSEGLQFTYDRNNKRGLFAGKQSWTDLELAELCDMTFVGANEAFARVHERIRQHWGSGK